MKDPFDLWWEWATKSPESMLMIDGDIHYAITELSREDRRDRQKGQRGCAAIPGKPQVQHLNRIGRRTIMCIIDDRDFPLVIVS